MDVPKALNVLQVIPREDIASGRHFCASCSADPHCPNQLRYKMVVENRYKCGTVGYDTEYWCEKHRPR